MKRFRDLLGPLDHARYLLWRGTQSRSTLEVQMRKGGRIAFRPPPSGDLGTAYEIFVGEAYRPPTELPERRAEFIVDAGANLGYSIVYFARRHAGAEVLAFEPHPAHLRLLYQHIHANELTRNVRVEACAVSNGESKSFLSDRGCESTVMAGRAPGRIPIKVRDFFAEVDDRPIDLLKMDIEGAEYSILGDPRMAMLPVRTLVLEWHNTADHPDGRRWCAERLRALGFRVTPGALDCGRAGILWGWKA
jgi:FkbM family methyltransferase